jgi:hypothetical protein
MPSVIFWKCVCGVEWMALYSVGGTTKFTCFCRLEQKVLGTVAELHYKPKPTGSRDPDWEIAPWAIFKPSNPN